MAYASEKGRINWLNEFQNLWIPDVVSHSMELYRCAAISLHIYDQLIYISLN